MRRIAGLLSITALLLAVAAPAASAQEDPVVRALLFYSPSCGHCHIVINEHLPGMFDSSGGEPEVLFDRDLPEDGVSFYLITNGSLEIMLIDVSVEAGAGLYHSSAEALEIPDAMMGVPRLIVGGDVFVGSGDIPAFFPGLIEDGLAADGIDWPALDGIDAALAAIPGIEPDPVVTETSVPAGTETSVPAGTETSVPAGTETTTPESTVTTVDDLFPDVGSEGGGSETVYGEQATTVGEKFRSDLAGNILAVIVLAGMLASLIAVGMLLGRRTIGSGPVWLIPLLAVAGVVVAVYLTYVETSGNEAVCGPVGNCNAVQESKFALLFGFIPVGIIGLIGYAAIIGPWFITRLNRVPWSDWARVAMAAGTVTGVGFSIYLTFLEPFVIGATCLWCLSSAIIVAALFWLSAGPGWEAWKRLRTD